MSKEAKAPKGKGHGKRKKANLKTISPSKKTPLAKIKPKKPVITLEDALKVLQANGIQVNEETVDQLQQIAKIPVLYTGVHTDKNRQLKKLMIQALEKTLGIVTSACRLAGVHRSTHYEWMEEDEEYSSAVKSLADVALDFAEEKLLNLVEEKHPAAVIFYMKTKGKKRGYIESVHNINQAVDDANVHIYVPDNEREAIPEATVLE